MAKKRSSQDKSAAGTLTEKAIRQWVDQRSFLRGKEYFESGAIYDCRREGDVIKARCEGQSANFYDLNARLTGNRIDKANCDCPVGLGGHCKHMVAMLLTWIHQPHKFQEVEPLEKRLAGCSKEQLIGLIKQMLDQEPELESWLELALPASAVSGDDVKPDAYRRQAIAAFHDLDDDWDAEREIAASLKSIVKIGDLFLGQNKFASAAAVYCGVLDGILHEYEDFDDDSGSISLVADECSEMLDLCLPNLAPGSDARQLAFETLFAVIRYDVHSGGIGLSDPIPAILHKHATPEERAQLVRWIREAASESDEPLSRWEQEYWDSLLHGW